jgi:hypothetical protein
MPLQECSGVFSLGIIALASPGLWAHSSHRPFKPQAKAGFSLWGVAVACKLNEQGGDLCPIHDKSFYIR